MGEIEYDLTEVGVKKVCDYIKDVIAKRNRLTQYGDNRVTTRIVKPLDFSEVVYALNEEGVNGNVFRHRFACTDQQDADEDLVLRIGEDIAVFSY